MFYMPEEEKRNKAVEFTHNLDLSQRVGILSEDLKKETRENEQKKLQADIDNLAYNALVQNKEDLGLDEQAIAQLTPEGLREEREDLYKIGLNYTQSIPIDRANNMLRNDLEGILSDIPEKNLGRVALIKEFNEALGDDELVREYSEVLKEYGKYKTIEEIVKRYKETGNFDDEKESKFFYANIAESVGRKFKEKLREKGYSEQSQNIGMGIAALSASHGLVKKDIVDKSAEDAVKEAEKKFRNYEEKHGKKLSDYARSGISKLVGSKETEKFNTGRNLLYAASKEYVADEKLEAKDEEYYRLLAA